MDESNSNKRWKMITLTLVGLALAGLALIMVFKISPWQIVRSALPNWQAPSPARGELDFPRPLATLGALLTLYLAGIVLLFLFPERMRRVSLAIQPRWGGLLRLAALGLLVGLLFLAAGVGSAFSMVTFPLTFFLAVMLVLSVMTGSIALAYAIGHALLVKSGWQQLSPLVALLLGELLLFVAINLPWVGPLVTILLTSLGLGAAIASRFGSGRPWSLNSLIEDGKE
jgi:hypothetical protein